MLFSIHRDSKEVPEVPGLGDFYAGFLGEIQDLKEVKPKRGIAKTQTWQHQKQILLNWAMHMAASQQAAELRAKRK